MKGTEELQADRQAWQVAKGWANTGARKGVWWQWVDHRWGQVHEPGWPAPNPAGSHTTPGLAVAERLRSMASRQVGRAWQVAAGWRLVVDAKPSSPTVSRWFESRLFT